MNALGMLAAKVGSMFAEAMRTEVDTLIMDAAHSAAEAANDAVRKMLMGKQSINEWAETVSKCIDNIKDNIEAEENLTFIGGKLRFTEPDPTNDAVCVAFDLYFMDIEEQWHKAGTSDFIPASMFTQEAVDELMSAHEIEFEVE